MAWKTSQAARAIHVKLSFDQLHLRPWTHWLTPSAVSAIPLRVEGSRSDAAGGCVAILLMVEGSWSDAAGGCVANHLPSGQCRAAD